MFHSIFDLLYVYSFFLSFCTVYELVIGIMKFNIKLLSNMPRTIPPLITYNQHSPREYNNPFVPFFKMNLAWQMHEFNQICVNFTLLNEHRSETLRPTFCNFSLVKNVPWRKWNCIFIYVLYAMFKYSVRDLDTLIVSSCTLPFPTTYPSFQKVYFHLRVSVFYMESFLFIGSRLLKGRCLKI